MPFKLNGESWDRSILDALSEAGIQARKAVRLRPMPANSIDQRSSKIGGLAWWPAKEDWPRSQEENCVLLAQLRRDEFPEISFKEGSDLLQIFWNPRYPDPETEQLTPDPIVIWRSMSDCKLLEGAPEPGSPDSGLVPAACTIHPERIEDLPSGPELLGLLSPTVTSQAEASNLFELCAPGSKVGGYAHWLQNPVAPRCPCGRGMETLLTLASWEYEENSRWEYGDPSWIKSFEDSLGNISGLEIGDSGFLYLFYCTHCAARPVRSMSQSL